MPVLLDIATLLVQETKASIYSTALGVATTLGLPVTSWQPGDPTRSLYHVLATKLAALDVAVTPYIRAGFLESAEGAWLKLRAKQSFNVVATEATYASTDVVLTNGGGGDYSDIEIGDLTFKNTTTGKTYRNTTAGDLLPGPGTTLTLTVTADEAGSDSSAGVGEIDDLVTTLLGVTVANAAAATGLDEEEDAALQQRCLDKLGSLSPNGPAAAYAYVAVTPALSGTTAVTRTRVYPDSATGDVLVYLAGADGAVAGGDVTLVESGIVTWSTPLTITPTIASAVSVPVAVTYSLWIYESVGETQSVIVTAIGVALTAMLRRRPIGGDIIPPALTGSLYKSMIDSTIRGTYPNHTFRVTVSAPVGDTALDNDDVATLGTVTPTVTFVADP